MRSAPRRIHILGGPGSGKSFLARRIARGLGISRFELDDLFWENDGSYGVRTDPEKRDARLAEIVAQPAWVLEGVYYDWLEPSFARADWIVVLQPSLWLRHWRVAERAARRLVGVEESRGESTRSAWALLRYSHTYDSTQLLDALERLSQHSNKLLFAPDGDSALSRIRSQHG
jgi:adenylate kinase family enzyme